MLASVAVVVVVVAIPVGSADGFPRFAVGIGFDFD
jgi:hypothetical protein